LGSIHLSAHTFGCDPIRVDILHRCVVYQRNKRRGKRNAGARTKTIHEVSGSGRKVRNQKGGGVARAGHSRPAHWRGGAKAHGPKGSVQDYTTKLNKKVRKMGVRHALSQKLLEGNLIVMGDLNAKSHKTKELEEALGRFGIAGKKGTVYGGLNVNLKVASGNLFKVKVMNQLGTNVYDLLKHEKLVLSLSAVKALEERL
ncbi:RM4, ribosomal protein 4, partial [Thalassiosira pseudonana CCMP1335]